MTIRPASASARDHSMPTKASASLAALIMILLALAAVVLVLGQILSDGVILV